MTAAISSQQQRPSFLADASMNRELRALELDGAVSGARMARAILRGVADFDAQGASGELDTLRHWATRNGSRLGPSARRVLSLYVRIAESARADGFSGLSRARMARLRQTLARAVEPERRPTSEPRRPVVPRRPDAPRPSEPRPDAPAWRGGNPNEFFKRQGFHRQYNNFYRDTPDRARDLSRNGNCGPTSLAMAVKAFGLEPAGISIQESIDRARRAMSGNLEDDIGTTQAQHQRAAKRLGLNAERINPNTSLEEQLAKGRMVVLIGRAQGAYKAAMRRTDPTYSLSPVLHAICVMGRDAAGNYLVADPISRRGVARMTRAEIHSYFRGQTSCASTAVWA